MQSFTKGDGSAFREGDLFVQPELANTLTTLSDLGEDAFYRGPIAEQIVSDMELSDGAVTLEDLAEYQARDAQLVSGSYRGFEIVGSDRPAAAPAVIEALHIVENFDATGPPAEWAWLVGQALLLALEDRASPVPPEEENTSLVISKEWARMRSRTMSTGAPVAMVVGPALGQAPRHTSHVSVADRDGMVIALTQSLGPPGGAAVATPGLGFLYASSLGGDAPPVQGGRRAESAMTPFLVLDGEEVAWVLGAAGGRASSPPSYR